MLSPTTCYGDEHYIATSLALHGEEDNTTCTEGVMYVNWAKTYKTGHPLMYSSMDILLRPNFFKGKRDGMTYHERQAERMCGGRRNVPEGWGAAETLEGVSCRTRALWGWDDEATLPKFNNCLFMRKTGIISRNPSRPKRMIFSSPVKYPHEMIDTPTN